MSDQEPQYGQSILMFVAAVALGVSLVGFIRGTSVHDYDFADPVQPHAEAEEHVEQALSYRELRSEARGEGSGFADDLASLHDALPKRTDAVLVDANGKAETLTRRAARRAYAGAPPVIPHPVQQAATSECIACHQSGVALRGHVAPSYPHAEYQVCVQCHAMAEPNLPWDSTASDDPRAVQNSFVGMAEPTHGPRWTDVAPPTIPHNTHMRERCDSCHGVSGSNPMRSTHPDRQSCEQCHAPAASLEWRPGGRD